MNQVYSLNDVETASLVKFKTNTIKSAKAKLSETAVTFIATGIGSNITVKCMKCGKAKDISDYGSW